MAGRSSGDPAQARRYCCYVVAAIAVVLFLCLVIGLALKAHFNESQPEPCDFGRHIGEHCYWVSSGPYASCSLA